MSADRRRFYSSTNSSSTPYIPGPPKLQRRPDLPTNNWPEMDNRYSPNNNSRLVAQVRPQYRCQLSPPPQASMDKLNINEYRERLSLGGTQLTRVNGETRRSGATSGSTPPDSPSAGSTEDQLIVPHQPPVNVRPDVGISDQDLVTIPTKELNKLLKKHGLSQQRVKEIKQQRRTLKNRGYAASCRVKREEEEQELQVKITDMRKSLQDKDDLREIRMGKLGLICREKKRVLEFVKSEMDKIEEEIRFHPRESEERNRLLDKRDLGNEFLDKFDKTSEWQKGYYKFNETL